VVVLVTRDAGDGLEESLRSLSSQDYRELVVLVVDAGSAADPTNRVGAILPDAYVLSVDAEAGFAEAANTAVASVEGARFVLFCHDDVSFAPDAIRQMVEESFRSDAAVVGPKLVRWNQPRELVSVGLHVDRFGVESPRVDPGEFDQEQHDGVEDVFSLSGAAILVRSEVFAEVGQFDEAISARGEVFDLCWRTQVSGYRVIVAPMARVRWAGEAQLRSPGQQERALLRRHRLRAILVNYSTPTLLRVVPLLVLHDLAEMLISMATGRRERARDVARSWSWNVANRTSARRRRQELKATRTLSDLDVRRMQEPGSTRLLRFLRARFGLSTSDRALTDLRGTVAEAVSRRIHADAIAVLGFAAFVFVVGSRHLISGPLPAVGDFVPLGDSASGLRSLWASGVRQVGLGSDVAAPTAFGVFGVAGWLPFVGLTGLQKLLILAMLPIGWISAWRMSRRVGSRRARLAVVLVYIAIPLPYNAIALGDWSALTAWAVAPLILGRMIDASGIEPLAVPRPPLNTVLGLGVVVALAATFSPVVVPLTLVIGAAMIIGTLLHGSVEGVHYVFGATLAAVGMAIVAHMPWSLDLITSVDGWTTIAGVAPRTGDGVGFARLMRFQTGPHGGGVLLVGLLFAAALALAIGRRWRLAAAIRLWTVVVTFWAIAALGDLGASEFSLPTPSLILAPAAAAIALSVGLSVATIADDLRAYRFGWRQFLSFVAPVALLITVAPIVVNSFDGRWKAPSSGYAAMFTFLADEAEQGGPNGIAEDFRVLWLGHPEVLPGDGWRLTEDISYLTTVNGSIGLNERWPSPETAADEVLIQDAILATASPDNARLGDALAALDIRYLVVLEGNAPAPRATVTRAAPVWLIDGLSSQLDLLEVQLNDAVYIYRNVASDGVTDSGAVNGAAIGAPAGSLQATTTAPAVRRVFQIAQVLIWLTALATALPLLAMSRRGRLAEVARRLSIERSSEAGPAARIHAVDGGSTRKGTMRRKSASEPGATSETASPAPTKRGKRRAPSVAPEPTEVATDPDEIDLRAPNEIDLRTRAEPDDDSPDDAEPSRHRRRRSAVRK